MLEIFLQIIVCNTLNILSGHLVSLKLDSLLNRVIAVTNFSRNSAHSGPFIDSKTFMKSFLQILLNLASLFCLVTWSDMENNIRIVHIHLILLHAQCKQCFTCK